MRDDSFLLLFNAHLDTVDFVLPDSSWGRRWIPEIDTVELSGFVDNPAELEAGAELQRPGLSLIVFRRA